MVKNFADGFLSVFRGMYIVFSSKRLVAIALVPILIGFIALICFASYVIPHYVIIHHSFEQGFTDFFGLISQNFFVQMGLHTLVFLLILALIFAGVYILFLITKLLASPFYAILASQVLQGRGVARAQNLTFLHWMILSFRTTAVNLVEIFVFMILGSVLFVFSFIPIINVLAAFGFFLIMAYDSVDYALDVLNLGLSARIKYFFSHIAQFCGFALAISLVMIIPGINLILFASSVAGAADLIGRDLVFLKQIQGKLVSGN